MPSRTIHELTRNVFSFPISWDFVDRFCSRARQHEPKKSIHLVTVATPLTPALSQRERENSKRRNTSRTRADAAAGVTVESRVHACIRSSDRSCVARTHH